jgi:ParB/RepB/Spo0J family partition protein
MGRKNSSASTDNAARPIGAMRTLALEDLLDDPANVRPKKDEDIAGLAQSIQTVGLLHAPIVRPDPEEKGKYRIVAGCRRIKAMRRLQWESVACMVLSGGEDEPNPDVVRVVENHQRKDLTPLQEAAAVRALLDEGLEIATVARSLGRSKAWVVRHSSLTDLSDVWTRAVNDPEDPISRWPPSHLELVSRFPAETQDRMMEYWRKHWPYSTPPALRDLDQVCAGFQQLLKAAPWDLEDETVLPEAGACSACPKRSSQHLELFPEELPVGEGKTVKGDRCLDDACWARKASAFLARRVEELREKHPDLVLVNNNEHPSGRDLSEQFPDRAIVDAWEVVRCNKSDENAQAALVVSGPGLGRLQYIKPEGELDAPVPGAASRVASDQAPAAAETAEETLARKREAYDKRRRQWVIDTVRERLKAIVDTGAISEAVAIEGGSALVERGMVAKTLFLVNAVIGESGWLARIHDEPIAPPEPVQWESLGKLPNHDIGKGELREALARICWRLARLALDVASRRLIVSDRENDGQYGEAEQLCAMLGFDLPRLRKDAAAAIPYAKAWRDQLTDEWGGTGGEAEDDTPPWEEKPKGKGQSTEPASASA